MIITIPKALFILQSEFGGRARQFSRYRLSLSLTFRTSKHFLGVGLGVHEGEIKRKERESPPTQLTSGKAGRFVGYLKDSCKRPSWRTVGCIRSWRLNMRKKREWCGGDEGGDIKKVLEERKRERRRKGEVTVPHANFHELRNRQRTARPWHRLPLIFYCPCLCRQCIVRSDDDERRLTLTIFRAL